MPDWVNIIVGWLAIPEVRAVLVGLIISWNGTQLIKSAPWLVAVPDRERRFCTRLLAFALGFWPVLILWPGPDSEAAQVALAVGLGSPAAYTLAARILYHFFPWLEVKMSATPVVPIEGPPR
jgi:hypothetical protein